MFLSSKLLRFSHVMSHSCLSTSNHVLHKICKYYSKRIFLHAKLKWIESKIQKIKSGNLAEKNWVLKYNRFNKKYPTKWRKSCEPRKLRHRSSDSIVLFGFGCRVCSMWCRQRRQFSVHFLLNNIYPLSSDIEDEDDDEAFG